MEKKLIYVADNQDLTRIGIISMVKQHFKNHVTFEVFKFRADLFERIKIQPPHLLIIDHEYFDLMGIYDFQEIKKAIPQTGILVVSDNDSEEEIKEVLKNGITNYILKSCDAVEFTSALEASLNNRIYVSNEIYDVLLKPDVKTRAVGPKSAELTKTELEIAKLIADGRTTKEIANTKNLSYHTINTHRRNIFKKLRINTSLELVKYSINKGWTKSIEYYI